MTVIEMLPEAGSGRSFYEEHPVARQDESHRINYLFLLALGIAVDREPTDKEREAYRIVARELGLEDAQLEKRYEIGRQEIASLVAEMRNRDSAGAILVDLAWIALEANGDGPKEREVASRLARLFGYREGTMGDVLDFVAAVRSGDHEEASLMFEELPEECGMFEAAQAALLQIESVEECPPGKPVFTIDMHTVRAFDAAGRVLYHVLKKVYEKEIPAGQVQAQ